jgi:tRNA(Arg) A34 adenosine deaminase TadA
MTCSPEQHKLDEDLMREALKIARDGLDRHQWPVGALLVYKNEIVA